MSLTYITPSELIAQAVAIIRQQLPDIDPTVANTWSKTVVTACATNAYSVELVVQDLVLQLFPQTATGDWLDIWGDYENLPRNEATSSSGTIVNTGTSGTEIPVGTSYKNASGYEFTSTSVAYISSHSVSISSITRTGTVATVTTASSHGFATGITATITGSDYDDYNGDFEITVTSSTTFTYTVANSPTTPATGTMYAAATVAMVPVTSTDTGEDVNSDAGASFTLQVSISGADSTAYANYDGVSGGADEEEDDDYRSRILLSRKSISGVFTTAQVKLAALSISGNTRAFVVTPEIDSTHSGETLTVGDIPAPGQLIVYILRDNDSSILPSQSILDQTKQAIIDNGALPSMMAEGDLYCFAPNTQEVDFVFSAIDPDSTSMQNAIREELQAFFQDNVTFETDIPISQIYGALANVQDSGTNSSLDSYTMTSPSSDITVSDGSIAVLGSVTFE